MRSVPGQSAKALIRSRLYRAMPPEPPNPSVISARMALNGANLSARDLIGPAARPRAISRTQPRHVLPGAYALVVLQPLRDRRGESGLGAILDLRRQRAARAVGNE